MTDIPKPAVGDQSWDDWAVEQEALSDTVRGLIVNVKDPAYGALGNGSTDDTAAFDAALDAAEAAGGGVVYVPSGTYVIDFLTLRNRVTIRGAGTQATVLKAKAASSRKGLVEIGAGPIQFAHLEDVQLTGVNTSGQCGVYANSVGNGGTPNHGGWWSGGLRNVYIEDFAAPCIWLRANGTAGLLPHQWLVLEGVGARATLTNEALLISGQVGQVAVVNGYYVGPNPDTAGVSVRVCRELADNRSTVVSDASPYGISFFQPSIQSNGTGVLVDRSLSVSLMGPHFEDVGKAVVVDMAGAATVTGANLQNAGHNTAVTGVALQGLNDGVLRAYGCSFFGMVDKHYDGNVQAYDTNHNGSPVVVGHASSGLTRQTAVQSGNYIDMGHSTVALCNTSATQLRTIRSWKAPGESVFIKALAGSIVLNYGGTAPGSIAASNYTLPLTVPQDAMVHLVRGDLAGDWHIVSVSGI